jgi:lambda family phage portal protein
MNIIDKVIAPFAPERALRRTQARRALKILNSGYSQHGASRIKNSLRGWFTRGSNADEDIVRNLETLRDRSRDLFMGTPLATGALKTIRTNVVGAGLRLNANIDFKYLGLTPEQAAEWEEHAEREFALLADTTNIDAGRRMTFGQLQGLAILSALMSGDAFAALKIKPRVGVPYDLRVALFEGDLVCNPMPIPPDTDIYGGIEQDADGEAIAAWVAKVYPRAATLSNVFKAQEWARIPFYGELTGRPNLLHITQDWERPGQRRGVPLLAPVMEMLKQLGRYSDAELMNAIVSAMFTIFVKSTTPQNPLQSGLPNWERAPQIDADDTAYQMGNGAIIGLADNEDISIANPSRANTAFEAFVKAFCEQIGAALELPKEVLLKAFDASYSASRGALLEAWKMFKMRRQWLIQTFCQPIYEEWLAEAVAKGRIIAPGFFEDAAIRAAWCGAQWYGPSQGHLNPLQEATAAKIRIEEELSTREREAAEFSGMGWEDIHPVRTREENERRRDGTIAPDNVFKHMPQPEDKQ